MSRIQIADLNSSEFGFLYDVNDTEMLAIVGGRRWKRFRRALGIALGVAVLATTGNPITIPF
jgi:hypothetical protein